MSACQELQEKIQKLKNLKIEFEAIYGALPPGSNREPAKREVLDKTNEKRDKIELLIEQIEKLLYWKVIKLGTFKTTNELRHVILGQGNEITGWAGDIIDKITLSQIETEIALYVMTVKDLTGKDRATIQEIHDAIKARGGQLCPAEVGPQLRLQYQDQSFNESLYIAMETIVGSAGSLYTFCVNANRRGSDRFLSANRAESGNYWSGSHRFVFVYGR